MGQVCQPHTLEHAQDSIGWVDGLVADGSEEKSLLQQQASHRKPEDDDGGGVFKAGVPISAVPDDGDWSVSPREKENDVGNIVPSAPEVQNEVASLRPTGQELAADGRADVGFTFPSAPQKQEPPPQEEADAPPTVQKRASEAFHPEERKYGEMPVDMGEIVHAFETLAQSGWVFGYKHTDDNQVCDQGWLPIDILVPLDMPLDDMDEELPQPPPPPPPPADLTEPEPEDQQDWKTAGRRPVGRNRGDRTAALAPEPDRTARPARPLRSDSGKEKGGKAISGRGRGDRSEVGGAPLGREKGGSGKERDSDRYYEKGAGKERDSDRYSQQAKGRDAKGDSKGKGGSDKGKSRGRHAYGR